MAGLITAVFIVLTCNIVTGIMIGFATLVIGRLCLANGVGFNRHGGYRRGAGYLLRRRLGDLTFSLRFKTGGRPV